MVVRPIVAIKVPLLPNATANCWHSFLSRCRCFQYGNGLWIINYPCATFYFWLPQSVFLDALERHLRLMKGFHYSLYIHTCVICMFVCSSNYLYDRVFGTAYAVLRNLRFFIVLCIAYFTGDIHLPAIILSFSNYFTIYLLTVQN